MVFKCYIDRVTRARASYLFRVKRWSVRKVAEICVQKEGHCKKELAEYLFKRGPELKLSEREKNQALTKSRFQ